MKHINLRLDDEYIKMLELIKKDFEKTTGLKITYSHVIRACINVTFMRLVQSNKMDT